MPVYQITNDLVFPYPEYANEEGLLGIGGDLSVSRLLLAYENGIFPWFSKGDPIMWWSPDPRCVIFPGEIHVSRSLARFISKTNWQISADTHFKEVITNCADIKRKGASGTWITEEMIVAYCKLHELGIAHSIEIWAESELIGGVYGLCIGGTFFGESMFSKSSNASKIALTTLCKFLKENNFIMLDCQIPNTHLKTLGASEISRSTFLSLLGEGNKMHTLKGKWTNFFQNNYPKSEKKTITDLFG